MDEMCTLNKIATAKTHAIWRDMLWLPLFFLVSSITLLVRMNIVEIDALTMNVYHGESQYHDYFSYWKSIYLTGILVFFSLFWLVVILVRRHTVYLPKAYYFLLIHGLLIFLSAVFSRFQWISYMGFPERLEGLYALMAYLAITVSFSWILSTDMRRDLLYICLFIVCILLSILGMSQYIGKDFLQTEFGRNILVASNYAIYRDRIAFGSSANIMYVTMYNPNNLGSYSAMLLPLSFGLLLRLSLKKGWQVIIGHVMMVASVVLWIGGMSRAGLLGGVIAMMLMALLTIKTIVDHWGQIIIAAVLCLTVIFSMNYISNGAVLNEFIRTMPERIAIFIPGGKELIEQVEQKKVLSVQLTGNRFTFVTETETLTIQYQNESFSFLDGQENELPLTLSDEVMLINDSRYDDYRLKVHPNAVVMQWKEQHIPVVMIEERLAIQMDESLFTLETQEPEHFGYDGRERFGSGRGYIWSRSFPLMKDTLLLGHGPDTFAAYFPQYELSAKINWLNHYNILVDKPHSWYLQMGINTGVLSLGCMVLFLLWFLFTSVRRSINMIRDGARYMQVAVTCAISGYCVTAFFNDSTVSVAPVFWSLLGVGLSYIIHEKTSTKASLGSESCAVEK